MIISSRTLLALARRKPWTPLKCSIQPLVRNRSSLAADASPAIEWNYFQPPPAVPIQEQTPSAPAIALPLSNATTIDTRPMPQDLQPSVTLQEPLQDMLPSPPSPVKKKQTRWKAKIETDSAKEATATSATATTIPKTRKPRKKSVAIEAASEAASKSASKTSIENAENAAAAAKPRKPRRTSLMVAAEKAVKADARDAKVKAKLRAAAKARAKAEAIADATAEATIASLRIPPSTYQEHAAANSPSFFPELAPAPFPQDIHSCMPYTNRTTKTGLIQGGSQSHNDLESFEGMEHNMDSTIYRGTLFEYQTQEILRNCLGIYTQRSAGNNDLGVDLRGTWFIPLSVSPRPGDLVRHLKVIVQCKRMNSNIGPKFVRELQGSLSYESQPTMALLAVSTNFTKQALKPYAKSLWPMCLVVIDTEKKECKELMWNRAAEKVMHGLQIGTAQSICERGKLRNRPVLCFNGHVVRRLPGPYLNDTLVPSTSSTSPEPLAETAFASTVVKDKSLEILGQERHVNYAIPDWNIATQPEYLYVVPEATRSIAISEDSSEDPDHHPPLSSSHVELLTWSPSPHIQTSVDTILDSSSNDLY